MAEVKIEETADYIVWRNETDAGFTLRYEAKPGSSGHSQEQLVAKSREARDRMRQIATAAPPFTNAQRDQAVQDIARVCANLIPLVLGEVLDPGD